MLFQNVCFGLFQCVYVWIWPYFKYRVLIMCNITHCVHLRLGLHVEVIPVQIQNAYMCTISPAIYSHVITIDTGGHVTQPQLSDV